jgi:hypothetical protein
MYEEYHSVCPVVGIGTLLTPLSPASVSLPPEPGGRGGEGGGSPNCGGVGGVPTAAGEGLGESQFRRLEKKLSALPTLWLMLSGNTV